MTFNANQLFDWSRKKGYEVSSIGDRKFSAFYAKIEGRTIEDIYQVDIKGHRSIKEGKGKPSLNGKSHDQLWKEYLELWKYWASENEDDLFELALLAIDNGYMLRDTFANTTTNQARALAQILNETFGVS